MIINDELWRAWKETIVSFYKLLQKRLPGGATESHKIEPLIFWILERTARYYNMGLMWYLFESLEHAPF
jgi:hypothetical protein